MTDKELKDLVASLAITQKETEKQMQETDKKIQSLLQSHKETEKQMQETDKKIQSLLQSHEETEKQMQETDRKLDKVAKLVGSISNNQGDVAEEYFVNSLKDILKIGNLQFDYLLNNVRLQAKKINDEFDILLVNGKSLALIEVKYKAHPNVIESLAKKIEHLKMLPQYKNYKIYAGVAGFYIPDELIKKAKEKGYFILKRKGNLIEEYVDNLIPA